ncbi:hypothetical protein EV361DRAFT_954471 [Lentinula raphanica]|nr:hypothetical protein EV361DRAFT_954471 [Lentinula raphanica]
MNTSNADTVPSQGARTLESQTRVLRPRKRVRPNYVEPEEPVVRLSRRRVKVPARFRRVRGVFAFLAKMLTDVPIEVIYEIFCYLDPRDLLTLSRTCKLLRGHLLRKSESVRIWRIALLNVEGSLPSLPKDLNEPQYACLMFDLDCHLCNKSSKGNIVLWKFRLRCCPDCVTSFRFRLYKWRNFYEELYPFTSFEIMPRERVRGADHDDIIVDWDVAKELKAQFMALESEETRRSWLIQKREEHEAIVQHARLCEAWHKEQLERNAAQLISLRTERREAILSRLEVNGLRREAELILEGSSDLKRPHELADLPCIKMPKALTDCGWAHIKSKLIAMLSDHRTRRLARQNYISLRDAYCDYLARQDLREIYPGLGDVLTDPVIEATLWDTEVDEALTPISLQLLLSEFLSRILVDWRLAKIGELLELLRKAHPCATDGDLNLATTVFGCAACNALLVYPQMFYHSCCYKNRVAGNQSHDRMRILNGLYDTVDPEGPWSSSSLFFHSQTSQFARKIVIGAGLDPDIATINDLTVAQPVIQCTNFEGEVDTERLFLTWPAALTYDPEHFNVFKINCSGEETSRVRAREPLCIFSEIICCTRCHTEIPPKKLSRHFHDAHNVNLPLMDSRDFYKFHDRLWYWNPRDHLESIGTVFRWG